MRIIVGLGNPGKQYDNTRHNAGFMVVNALANELGLNWENNKKLKSEVVKIPGLSMSIITNGFITADTILVKPQTFMNNSGQAVAAVLKYYIKHPLDKGGWGDFLANILTVIHDDLDIELGKFKISVDSRSAGHQGVQSIIDSLKTKNFKRVRIGIKTPALEKIPADLARRSEAKAAKFVLQKFNGQEKEKIEDLLDKIIKESR